MRTEISVDFRVQGKIRNPRKQAYNLLRPYTRYTRNVAIREGDRRGMSKIRIHCIDDCLLSSCIHCFLINYANDVSVTFLVYVQALGIFLMFCTYV